MTRSILFDTETTGLHPLGGDRVVEIAALELMNDLPTGREFHAFLDPKRDMPEEAARIHGLTGEFLRGKPLFESVAAEMLAFFGEDKLIAHNAPFDFGFLDMELSRAGLPGLDRRRMVDSLAMAKSRFPGMPNSLDALCRRFDIDLSERGKHNALLDCRLLAKAYLELTGGRQRGLSLRTEGGGKTVSYQAASDRTPRPIAPSPEDEAAHAGFIDGIESPIWRR